jgi:hypothetical protein
VPKAKQPTPVKAELYSVLTIGVPKGQGGQTATVKAVEVLRRHGYGAGILAEAIGAESTIAIRGVINSTAAAVKAELADQQTPEPTEGADAQ